MYNYRKYIVLALTYVKICELSTFNEVLIIDLLMSYLNMGLRISTKYL